MPYHINRTFFYGIGVYNAYRFMTHTTISVSPEVRDRVKSRKRGGEPYDAVLERLLEGGPAE